MIVGAFILLVGLIIGGLLGYKYRDMKQPVEEDNLFVGSNGLYTNRILDDE